MGAHASGLIGEDPKGIPNNLMPFIQQVAVGIRPELSVFGTDYPTPDGTGVRDYIHVVDLAKGHLAALRKMAADRPGYSVWNLGTGIGFSVLEMASAFEAASGRPIPRKLVARRPGDVACVYASTSKAYAELGWRAELGLEAMCADAWRWASGNPQGYAAPPVAEAAADAQAETVARPAEGEGTRAAAVSAE